MKKLLKSTLVACLMICMLLGFTACGAKPLTEENIVGRYQITQLVYTPSEDNHGLNRAVSMSRADYDALVARREAGTATAQDEEDYTYFSSDFECVMEVRADGTIYDYYGDDPEMLDGYWEIVDGKIEYTCELNTLDQFTAEWDNGKIIITWTLDRSDTFQGTTVWTYERID